MLSRFLHEAQSSRKPGTSDYRRPARAFFLSLTALVLVMLVMIDGYRDVANAESIGACDALSSLAGDVRNAGPALQACLDATQPGGTVAIPPGRYLIATPIRILRPVVLRTQGLDAAAPPCFANEARCALFHLAIVPALAGDAIMPVDIVSNAVRLDGLVFQGTRLSDPGLSKKRCASDKERPMAGGLRINGDNVLITRSVFRDMACYTAVEYGSGTGSVIRNNAFTGNGAHNVNLRWADGLTIHNARRFQVTDNRFRDNTDVQLIFGSCVDCTVTNNHFSHSGTEEGGSFAEIMLQAWPKTTSGDFTGAKVARNMIDCGPQYRCGFGIMIGSAPWYEAPAFGGAVTDNKVRGAMLALNVDKLTGPMVIERNDLNSSTGSYPTMCGPRSIQGVTTNISPASLIFLSRPKSKRVSSTHHCILNYKVVSVPLQ